MYLGVYNCAFSHKILLQGKLYIFPKKICFFSYFNNKNLLVGETVLDIPAKDVLDVKKINIAKFFDTGVELVLD